MYMLHARWNAARPCFAIGVNVCGRLSRIVRNIGASWSLQRDMKMHSKHTRFAKLHKITLNMPNLWGEITFFHRWIADEQSFTSRYIVFVLVHCARIYVYAFMSISIYSYSIYIESHFTLHFRYISVLSSRWNYNFQIPRISLCMIAPIHCM